MTRASDRGFSVFAVVLALAEALSGCARETPSARTHELRVEDEEGRALPGVLVEAGPTFRAYTDDRGRARVPRDRAAAVEVRCPTPLEGVSASAERGAGTESIARGVPGLVVCRRRVVPIALGVVVDEERVATVLVDGREVGKTEEGVLLTVLTLPASTRAEVALVDVGGEARFGSPRLLSVGDREQLFLVAAAYEAGKSRPRSTKRAAPIPEPPSGRPYRIGR